MNNDNKIDEKIVTQFNQELDVILVGQELQAVERETVYADMLQISKMLAAADLTSLSRNHNRTWQQVMRQQQKNVARRRLTYAVITAVTAVSLVFVFTIAPLQAWAKAILARIGTISIIDQVEWTEEQLRELNDDSDKEDGSFGQQLSQEQAGAKAGFNILMPTYLPDGLEWATTDVYTDTNAAYVSIAYTGAGVLTILQWKMPPEMQSALKIGDATMTEVTIRGNKGYSIENVGWGAVSSGSAWQPGTDNGIIWEEGSIIYQVVSGGANSPDFQALPISELRKIAESLTP